MEPEITTLSLKAKDGYLLTASLYQAQGVARGNLIMAGATGAPRRFYRHFAGFAAKHGFNVLTLDYRGVGDSRPESLKGFSMRYMEWATQDLAAAVEFFAKDALPLYWVGHSFGGHALGLLPNADKITSAFCLGTGAGWAGWMPLAESLKVRLMWQVVLPIVVAFKGYLAWSRFGMGEDLPLGVYKDWKQWCSYPHYFFDDPAMSALTYPFTQLKCPKRFANATDDAWALPRSRDAFIQGYSDPKETSDLNPAHYGGKIGHMGYFFAGKEQLWTEVLDWLINHKPFSVQPTEQDLCGAV